MPDNDKTPTEVPETPETTPKRRFRLPDKKVLIAAGTSFAAGALSVLFLKKSKDDDSDAGELEVDPTEVTETFEA